MSLLILLLPLAIIASWARLFRPGTHQVEGRRLFTVPLPLLARLRMHAIPSLVILALSAILAAEHLIHWSWTLVPMLSVLVMVLFPVKYLLTDRGICLGWTAYHRWTEFSGVRRSPGGAKLIGIQGSFGYRIWLSGSRGDDEFLQFLRQTIRNAYKGQSAVIQFPTPVSHEPGSGPTGPGNPVSAMTADVD